MLHQFLREAVKSLSTKSEKLVFHMAVMRWKVDALKSAELDKLHSWIDEQQKLKEQAHALPWLQEADEYADPHFTENSHVQRYVIWGLPSRQVLTSRMIGVLIILLQR